MYASAVPSGSWIAELVIDGKSTETAFKSFLEAHAFVCRSIYNIGDAKDDLSYMDEAKEIHDQQNGEGSYYEILTCDSRIEWGIYQDS